MLNIFGSATLQSNATRSGAPSGALKFPWNKFSETGMLRIPVLILSFSGAAAGNQTTASATKTVSIVPVLRRRCRCFASIGGAALKYASTAWEPVALRTTASGRIRSQTRHKRYEFNSFKLVMNYSWRKWSCNSFSKPLTTYISRPSIANDVGNCKPSPRYYVYCCPYFYLNTLTSLPNNVLFRYGSKARNISVPTNL